MLSLRRPLLCGVRSGAWMRRVPRVEGRFGQGLRGLCSTSTGITITPRCAERITHLNTQRGGSPRLLRVSVEPGGCSGFQYSFGMFDPKELEAEDSIFENGEARVAVDEFSLGLLRGATVDYEDDIIRSAFVVSENPLADASCGCGSSFQAKDL